jgi:FkbM family methyltransferase
MNAALKSAIKRVCSVFGLEVNRTSIRRALKPGSPSRPVGETANFLEDIRARGFVPRGIIDVGANQGDWSRLALSIFPGTPLIMIEPQDEMQSFLLQLSRKEIACHYVKAGAGREPGELVQTIWPDRMGSSFLPEVDESRLRTGEQRKTQMVTIDQLLAERFSEFIPDLVKLDIQGFELEALSGAETILGRTEVFILETSLFQFMPRQPITREVISFMSERGYEMYDITQYLRRPYDGALGQLDLAFVKAGGRFRAETKWSVSSPVF